MNYQRLGEKPKIGDLVIVKAGARLESVISNEEMWNEKVRLGIVINVLNRYLEDEDNLSQMFLVYVSCGFYKIPDYSIRVI